MYLFDYELKDSDMDTIIFQVDNELKDSDMDGLEPPLLDEKWGLSAALNGNL